MGVGMSIDPVEAGHSHRLIEAKRLMSKITGMLQITDTTVRNAQAVLTWDGQAWLVYSEATNNIIYASHNLSAAVDMFIAESAIS